MDVDLMAVPLISALPATVLSVGVGLALTLVDGARVSVAPLAGTALRLHLGDLAGHFSRCAQNCREAHASTLLPPLTQRLQPQNMQAICEPSTLHVQSERSGSKSPVVSW
jgi:hypothetical protein